MSISPYLRSAMVRFPLGNLEIGHKAICWLLQYRVNAFIRAVFKEITNKLSMITMNPQFLLAKIGFHLSVLLSNSDLRHLMCLLTKPSFHLWKILQNTLTNETFLKKGSVKLVAIASDFMYQSLIARKQMKTNFANISLLGMVKLT